MEIPLQNGGVALIDDQDHECVSELAWSWSGAGVVATIEGKKVLLHRFIMQAPAGIDVVHLNSDKRDNRRGNLQKVEHGLAGLIDRESTGLRSLLPILRKIQSEGMPLGRKPRTESEAVKIKEALIVELREIEAILGSAEIKKQLQPHQWRRWREQVISVKNAKLAYYQEIKRTIKQETQAWRERRPKRGLPRLPEYLGEIDPNDPVALLRVSRSLIKRLYVRTGYRYSPEEQAMVIWIDNYLKVSDE